jgi:hypothetical protein
MLFEDSLVIRDREALAGLFEESAMFDADNERQARGREEITRLALATWDGDHAYVADPQRVIQARDVALIVEAETINVIRRDRDGAWRYAIVLRLTDDRLGRRAP